MSASLVPLPEGVLGCVGDVSSAARANGHLDVVAILHVAAGAAARSFIVFDVLRPAISLGILFTHRELTDAQVKTSSKW